jgi:3,4-dihydroxy 2-butanone 4-phosphate synthase/GTP cyclohydrolase II
MLPDRYFEDLERSAHAHHARLGIPLVTLSYAQGIDGSLCRTRGVPLALSGPESLAFTHRLRSAHAAILVGIGTVLSDDPRLTARGDDGLDPRPIVLDTHLRTPPDARLWAHPATPWIFTGQAAAGNRRSEIGALGGRLIDTPLQETGMLDLESVLADLGRSGVRSVMVEGGAAVITSFLSCGLADRAAITIAPVFIGGVRAPEGPVEGAGLVDVAAFQLGPDIVLTGRFERG